ncbi:MULTISPECIES: cytochrome c oxidase assembly protein [unclassified Yoonia]|uniref:cytochrome c oxidase assembly protein n=1 Tax=unclassified Yoonia TaxID=2629118 RepID=UPI002AFEE3A4|nr:MULTISPECIES: cytochrome c oxidase assembly protein [unclassified Yoonia]
MQNQMPYCGPAPNPADWLGAWNLDPFLITALVIIFVSGALLLRGSDRKRQNAFALAGLAAVIAFVSPLCAMTVALFSARTIHHLIIFGALAPALAIAFSLRRISMMPAFVALSVVLWLWHVPAIYSAAWESISVYWLLQIAFILPAWAFWSAVLRARDHSVVVWLIALVGQMGLLGALLTFAQYPFYLEHLAHAERFGLSALEDQQLAGLIMWVPGMVPVAIVAALLAWRLFHERLHA